MINVSPIEVVYNTGFGNSLEIRGDAPALGLSWEAGKPLAWNPGNRWTFSFPAKAPEFAYKIVLRKADGTVVWEPGHNGHSAVKRAGIITYTPYTVQSSEYSDVEGDPLNLSQKQKIVNYVLRELSVPTVDFDPSEYDIVNTCRAIAKTYDSFDPASLAKAKRLMTAAGRSFDDFRKTLRNPAEKAGELGLDPTKKDQIVAAQIWIKMAIKTLSIMNGREDSFHKKMEGAYRARMAQDGNMGCSKEISVKNRMLLEADPVQASLPGVALTPEEVVLSNIYFKEPYVVQKNGYSAGYGQPTVWTETRLGPTREQARAMIKGIIQKLFTSDSTRHVMQALAALIAKEKGTIFISSNDMGVGKLGEPYHVSTSVFGGTGGFYVPGNHHSIMMASLINPVSSTVCKSNVGTLVHEALHFLFSRVVREEEYEQTSSPTKKGSEEERLLDEALAKDRAHRTGLSDSAFPTSGQRSVWHTLVETLEDEGTYFPGGFKPENKWHREVMRSEAIVRVMEQAASGTSSEDFRAVAPNLFAFYHTYSKPMLERYFAENRHLFRS